MKISNALRYQVLRRDGYACRYCGAKPPDVELQVDHILAEALGGRTVAENLATACGSCNNGKSATPPDAALLDDISDEEIRWSLAIDKAGGRLLADLAGRQRDRDEFRTCWAEWTLPNGEPAELPSNWQTSVDRLIAVGLPLPVLLDDIDTAMSARKIPARTKFQYMCGIAWNQVTEMQTAARASLANGDYTTEWAEPPESIISQHEDVIDQLVEDLDRLLRVLPDDIGIDARTEANRRLEGQPGAGRAWSHSVVAARIATERLTNDYAEEVTV